MARVDDNALNLISAALKHPIEKLDETNFMIFETKSAAILGLAGITDTNDRPKSDTHEAIALK